MDQYLRISQATMKRMNHYQDVILHTDLMGFWICINANKYVGPDTAMKGAAQSCEKKNDVIDVYLLPILPFILGC